jgi:hypothetical protein
MIIKELLHESADQSMSAHKDNFMDMFQKFIPLAMHYIELDSLPEMEFVSVVDDEEQPTFGRFDNNNNTLTVALMNRHPNDILRTLAHELVHYKQSVEHELNNDSGRTGSPEENQAHQVAGVVMRHFNKQYPEFLKSKPIT